MMKRILFAFAILISLCYSCTDNTSEKEPTTILTSENASASNAVVEEESLEEVPDSSEFTTPVPLPDLPPKSEEVKKILDDAALKSVFLHQGCCEEKAQRLNSCCCDAVLALYKKMKEEENDSLGKYKSTDPILGNCRKKYQEAFDKIDFPESEDDGEEMDLEKLKKLRGGR